MKVRYKITLASIGLFITIATGVLTMVEKTVNIVTALKPTASVSNEKSIVMGEAGRVEKETEKTTARMSK
jgi:hypothetical protein